MRTSAGDGGGFQGCWRDRGEHSRLRNTHLDVGARSSPPTRPMASGPGPRTWRRRRRPSVRRTYLTATFGHAVPPALVVGPRHVALRRQTQSSRGKTACITIVIFTRPIALRSSRETTFVTGTLSSFRSPSERTSRSSSVMGQKDELKPLLFNGNGDTARSEKERITRYQSLVST